MNFISSLIIILIFAGLFVLMYVIGGIIDSLEKYITSRKEKQSDSPMANGKERA
ncbi:MAG: hypothetical protein NC452_05820 [Eubacterium sp.]|nr:hypothetical protein [Eubacterium sp.]